MPSYVALGFILALGGLIGLLNGLLSYKLQGQALILVRKGARPVRLGYFWIRLIFTIGWAIYPILHFVDVVIGSGQASGVVALYTLFDLINLITPSLIVLAVASQERY